MELVGDRLLLSASDLINHLECPRLSRLDRAVALGETSIAPTRDEAADLLARKGDEHELAYLESLRAGGRRIVEIAFEPGLSGLRRAAARTSQAMRAGAEVIYQAVLFDGERWRGHADFLERVARPSAVGDWSYEVADTKLARRVKPYFLLQLCLYSELLAASQGSPPERAHVVLGTRARESFRLAEFAAYYRGVKRRFERLVLADGAATYPEPVDHCGLCHWQAHCDAQRESDDHLSPRGSHAPLADHAPARAEPRACASGGSRACPELARATADDRPPRMGPGAFDRLRHQAHLQVEQRANGRPRYELLNAGPERGFARLPPPSAGDVYFDMECDPFFDDGLEYLFGVTWVEDGEARYRPFWATTRTGERRAFEEFIDFILERRERFPDLHVYHYAPYEPTALERLMGLHATREDALDDLLRHRVLVDLYAVVREALLISRSSYSLRQLESFYMGERETDVSEAGDSIIAFERPRDRRAARARGHRALMASPRNEDQRFGSVVLISARAESGSRSTARSPRLTIPTG